MEPRKTKDSKIQKDRKIGKELTGSKSIKSEMESSTKVGLEESKLSKAKALSNFKIKPLTMLINSTLYRYYLSSKSVGIVFRELKQDKYK